MSRFLPFFAFLVFIFPFAQKARAQNNQVVKNGAATSPVNFPASNCIYLWTNDSPGIGLPASGTGSIPSFTAVNTGNTPVVATITATAVPNGFAYISNQEGNYVSVISTATNTVIKAIPVGQGPVGVVVSPDGSRVYVANTISQNVSVIDTKNNAVINTVTVDQKPTNITISPDGKLLYVLNSGSADISVINTATNAVTGTIPVNPNPYDLAVSPDGSRIYVTYGMTDPVVSVINAAAETLITNITLNENVTGLLISNDGSRVYLTNTNYGVSVINTTTNTEMPSIAGIGGSPLVYANSIAQSPDGSRLYAAFEGQNSFIAVFNTLTNKVIDTVTLYDLGTYGIGVTPDGSKLYITGYGYNQVTVVDPVTHKIGPVIIAGGEPSSFNNFITGSTGCINPPVKFTITVNPTPVQPPVITTGALNGSISACFGSASVSPSLQQFTVTGTNLTGDITATAPNGFELSLSPGSGFGKSVTIARSGNAVNNVLIYVRSAASDPVGAIAGDVLITSNGATSQAVMVNGIVNILPALTQIPNQKVNNGDLTAPVIFPTTVNTFSWTNDMPGIGLAAAGTGNIASFTAINTGTAPVTATITVTPVPSPLAYVTNNGSNNVSVINAATNTVINTINVGRSPNNVAISADGSRAYVVNQTSSTISIINTLTNLVIATIPIYNYGAQDVSVSPDGSRLYVVIGGPANQGSCQIMVINANNNAIIANIPVPDFPLSIAISPDGNKVYVPVHGLDNTINSHVLIIDTKTNLVTGTITVGRFALDVSLSPDGSRMYVSNEISGTISVISTANNQVTATIPVGQDPEGIAVSPDGSKVYIAVSGYAFFGGSPNPGSVAVINAATNSVITSIPVGQFPVDVSVTPNGGEVYVLNSGFTYFIGENSGNGDVSVINTSTNTVIKTLLAGQFPISSGNFISPGLACSGTPVEFTITVYPSPVIKAGTVSGAISACTGNASASPDIEQFTVSALNLTANLIATAPPGFQISLSANGNYSNILTFVPSTGMVANTVIYVRSSATDPSGNLSGNVVLSSAGATSKNVAVTGSISTPASPSVTITASATSVCTGTPITFTATPLNGGSTPVYQWMLNGVNTGTNNPLFTGSTFANGDVISCTITSNAACAIPATAISNSVTMMVKSQASPSVSISASANGVCAGTPVTFTAIPSNGGDVPSYQWQVNGNNAGANSATFTSNMLANGDMVNCVITNSTSCSIPLSGTSTSITMAINALPVVNAGGDKTLKFGGSVILNATATGDITDITWSPATGLSDNKILNPVASPLSTTTYTLLVQSADGCTAMDNLTVTVSLPDVFIPNIFTPNADGTNDTWDIKHLDIYTNCTVQVFSRWGQPVYSSTGYGNPWNGSYRGRALPSGTYYYIIDLKNNSKLLSGFVAIIR